VTDRIKLNAIKCVHCGALVVSTHRHHFATHACAALEKKYGAEAFIAADGGNDYLRRLGHREDWLEVSEWGQP
jgi:phosphoribosylcarboxyaminoimidazole (NCAIR) mutase